MYTNFLNGFAKTSLVTILVNRIKKTSIFPKIISFKKYFFHHNHIKNISLFFLCSHSGQTVYESTVRRSWRSLRYLPSRVWIKRRHPHLSASRKNPTTTSSINSKNLIRSVQFLSQYFIYIISPSFFTYFSFFPFGNKLKNFTYTMKVSTSLICKICFYIFFTFFPLFLFHKSPKYHKLKNMIRWNTGAVFVNHRTSQWFL